MSHYSLRASWCKLEGSGSVGFMPHGCKGGWVCAILDDGGLWHHLRGITRRETSVTM
jgi:hypothetical protein